MNDGGGSRKLPPVLEGFEGIKRYWDNAMSISSAKLMPGEVYVSEADEMIMTVLGSCVSACIRNPKTKSWGYEPFYATSKGGKRIQPHSRWHRIQIW